jgi:CRP/FNR family transcriptional regulator
MPKTKPAKTIKLHSFREATCENCSLRTLCLPLSLKSNDMSVLDPLIHRGRPLKKGEHLFRQGDKLDSLYALRSGCVRTYSVTGDGDEQTTGFYLPSELLGLSGIDTDAYPISAVAIETTSVCEIPYAQFDALTNEIPDLKRQLIHSMSKEMRSDLNMMMLLSQKSADERVANFILDLSTRIQRRGYAADFIYLAMSRNDIANYLGLAVETVSRVFSRLQKSGIISVNGRAVEVNDSKELAHAAGTCLFASDKDCGADQQNTN